MTQIQTNFDTDYTYVRKLLLRGNIEIGDAKLWLEVRSKAVEHQMMEEKEQELEKRWSSGVDREEKHINKLLGVDKKNKGEEKDE